MPLYCYPNAEEKAMVGIPGHPGMTWSTIHVSTEKGDRGPVTVYFFDMAAGDEKQDEGPYEYSETFYIISGTLGIQDKKNGTEFLAKKGDVVYLEKGDVITYWSPDGVHSFVIAEATF